jgi:hypothetical protein
MAFEGREEGIGRGEQAQVDRKGVVDGGLRKALGPPIAVGVVGNRLADLG